jgi:hypothetical protein
MRDLITLRVSTSINELGSNCQSYRIHLWLNPSLVKEMTVQYCCRIYAVITAGFLSGGLLAPEGASAALTERAVQQRALLFANTPDDGNEGDEGDEGDEVRLALLLPSHFTPCTVLSLLFDTFSVCACINPVLQLAQAGMRERVIFVTALSIGSSTVPGLLHPM